MSIHQQRRDKLRRAVRKAGAEGILVTDFTNVTYLTGFTGDDSYLLLTAKDTVLVSDMRYTTQLEAECPDVELSIRGPGMKMLDRLKKVVSESKIGSLAIEADSMTVGLSESLEKELAKVSLHSTSGLVEKLRAIKDKQEVEAIREAGRIAERAFSVIRALMRPEQTEKEIADELDHQLRLFGAKCSAFPAIIAVGPWAALPHATPGERRIGEAPFVLIDWGARGGLYNSDLTRVLITGKVPAKYRKMYDTVLAANQAGIKAVRPGATCQQVDAAARAVIEKAGFGKQFGHGLGHGLGMQVHESPRLGKKQTDKLEAGMVITIEPGIYFPGYGGVRIEDDVLVTSSGQEVLTSYAKQFDEMIVE